MTTVWKLGARLGLAGLLLAGLGGVWLRAAGSYPVPAGPPPSSEPVIHAIGYVDAEPGVAQLTLARPGRVAEVLAREGQTVPADTVLVRLDNAVARAKLQEAEAARVEATRAWEAAQQLPDRHAAQVTAQAVAIRAAEARRDAIRWRVDDATENYKNKGAYELKTARDQLRAAEIEIEAEEARLVALKAADPKPDVARAAAAVAVRRAQVEQAKEELALHVLRAPAAGTVLRVLAHVGEAAGAQPVVVFVPAGRRIVRVDLDPAVAGAVRIGCPVTLEADDDSGRTWAGRVIRVADQFAPGRADPHDALPFRDRKTLECVVAPDGELPLKLNEPVRVRLAVGGG